MPSYNLRWRDAPELLGWFILLGLAGTVMIHPPAVSWPIRLAIGAVTGAITGFVAEAVDGRFGRGDVLSVALRRARHELWSWTCVGIILALWLGRR